MNLVYVYPIRDYSRMLHLPPVVVSGLLIVVVGSGQNAVPHQPENTQTIYKIHPIDREPWKRVVLHNTNLEI